MNVYVREVYERMARLGHVVRVYARWHPDAIYDGSCRCYELVHIPVGAVNTRKENIPELLPEFAAAVKADAEDSLMKFDLIASHYWLSGVVGVELAKSSGIPHVTSFHTLAAIKRQVRPEEDEPEIRFVNEERIARSADGIVAWTDGESEFLVSQLGAARDAISIIPPGVDADFFNAGPSVGDTDGTRRILYVGRLDALKGIDLLIDAFAVIARRGVDAQLRIVGGGTAEEYRRVLGRISKLRLDRHVKMDGVLDQSELPAVYTNAACIVAPSFHETFGLAVLEAAACGTPAVAADVDGLRSIVVDRETGYLIPERDPALYADKIIALLENDELRQSMSSSARRRAESLTWDQAVDNLIGVYRRAVNAYRAVPVLR